jgi:hypothetical protein
LQQHVTDGRSGHREGVIKSLSKLFTSCNAIAASTVPAQIRKSFAVMSFPAISLR